MSIYAEFISGNLFVLFSTSDQSDYAVVSESDDGVIKIVRACEDERDCPGLREKLEGRGLRLIDGTYGSVEFVIPQSGGEIETYLKKRFEHQSQLRNATDAESRISEAREKIEALQRALVGKYRKIDTEEKVIHKAKEDSELIAKEFPFVLEKLKSLISETQELTTSIPQS